MGINFDVLNLGVVSCKILQRHSSLPLLCPCSFSKSFHACDSKIPVVQCAVVSHKAILAGPQEPTAGAESPWGHLAGDRKSTRLNSSHLSQSRMPSSA